jgi:hypothetical protein
MDTRNKLAIYKVAIRPMLTYGAPALRGIADAHLSKMQRFQSRTLKMILDKPWYTSTREIHHSTKTPMIKDHINRLTLNFESKLN